MRFGKATRRERRAATGGAWRHGLGVAEGFGVGFGGGVEFGWLLSPHLALEIFAEYRYLKFDY